MISITCTQCQAVLTIDDAFAGGVCRCQHCGTIQTVPSALKATVTPQPFVNSASTKSKTLYQNEAAARSGVNVAAAARTSSGLDDLAQAVGASSSGLSGSGLRSAAYAAGNPSTAVNAAPAVTTAPVADATPEPETAAPQKVPVVAILLGAGAIILLLLGVIAFMAFRPAATGSIAPGATAAGPASFGGVTIAGSRVVYLLDDANSIANDFDPLRAATFQSINSLGADHKFAVVLWNNGDEQVVFPKEGLAPATESQVGSLRAEIQDITATGQSQLRPSLERALSRNPDAIVIVTAKSALEQDDQSALATAQENSGGKIKFYTFTVGPSEDNPALKMTAKATGGEYRHLSSQELRALTP